MAIIAETMERQDFIAYMTDALRGEAPEDLLDGRVNAGRTKSRILEAHPPEASEEGCATLLTEFAEPAALRVERIADNLFALISSSEAFFFDVLNPRFWQIHSTASTRSVSRLLRRHLLRDPRLDSAWLSQAQLEELEGERQWMKSSFASDALLPAARNRARRWRVQIEGEAPEELLAFLAEDERYAPSAALSAIGTTVTEPGIGHARVIADYRGAMTSDGDSFELVSGIVWRTVRRYERYVRSLEAQHQLRTESVDDVGLQIEGDVAMIEFARQVGDLPGLLAGLFSCREPFRLWGVPREVHPGYWEANAVDLHVGQPLRLEITDRWLRVLLTERTCGNTLARLIANLQHHFDARTQTLASVA